MFTGTNTLSIVWALLKAALQSGAGTKGEESIGVWVGERASWSSEGEGEESSGDGEDDGVTHFDWGVCVVLYVLLFGVRDVCLERRISSAKGLFVVMSKGRRKEGNVGRGIKYSFSRRDHVQLVKARLKVDRPGTRWYAYSPRVACRWPGNVNQMRHFGSLSLAAQLEIHRFGLWLRSLDSPFGLCCQFKLLPDK